MKRLEQNNIKFSSFHEPDIENQVTAIAIEPCEQAKRLVSSIPTALREFNNTNLINKNNYNEVKQL